jgi:hypothetical protein
MLLPYANTPATREPTRGGIRYIWLTSRAFIKRFYYGETAPNQYGEVTGALFNYRAWWMLANTPLDATLREDTSTTSPAYRKMVFKETAAFNQAGTILDENIVLFFSSY